MTSFVSVGPNTICRGCENGLLLSFVVPLPGGMADCEERADGKPAQATKQPRRDYRNLTGIRRSEPASLKWAF